MYQIFKILGIIFIFSLLNQKIHEWACNKKIVGGCESTEAVVLLLLVFTELQYSVYNWKNIQGKQQCRTGKSRLELDNEC